MPDSPDPIKDFNAIELSVQAHGEGIISLGSKVSALEETLKDPKLLAKTLEDAAEESTRLKKLFSKIFCEMMKDDKEVTTSIQDKINAMDRDTVKVFWKNFGGRVVNIIGAVLLLLAGALIDHFFKK